MFREIRLGDFGGIEKNDWVELWAGLLGAIPASILSAAVAAWVATRVLNRSNKHQKELSDLQLDRQREEAVLARERAALADVIAGANGLQEASRQSRDAINLEDAHFTGAVIRWRLELGPGDMSDELKWWDGLLLAASVNHFEETKKGLSGQDEKAFVVLNNLASALRTLALRWQSLDERSKRLLMEEMKTVRERETAVLEEMLELTFLR